MIQTGTARLRKEELMAEITVKELNDFALCDVENKILEEERVYSERIEQIAERIVSSSSVRLILLAGPSGSGKTTTANLIADAIRRRGVDSTVLSLDDFYRNVADPDYPRNKKGELDFECPEALCLGDLTKTLSDICEGKPFLVPKYEFKSGSRIGENLHESYGHGCVIIEGLHALNPSISSLLPTERVLKLFVSVSTNINKKGIRILSGRKVRFIRRLVRDSIYRGASAEKTLSFWRGVLAAEDDYLYPYKQTADMAFNTFHTFELGVMKPYAEALITKEVAAANPIARTALEALSELVSIPEGLVPETSLIREFIPGGIYEDLY